MSPTAGTPDLFIGVDGGGTRCRVRLRNDQGAFLGSAVGGSANVYLAFDRAIETIRHTIDEACAEAGLGPAILPRAHLGLGLAGVSSPAVARLVEAALPGFGLVRATNDGVTACLGAHAGQDGGLVIAGTGSVAVLRLAGQDLSFGGRGFVLGDDGSGAVVGRSIWRRALRALDGLEPASPLLAALLADFDRDPVAIIAWARTAPSHAFAETAPRVFAAATAGDEPAIAVAAEAGHAISDLIETLAARSAPRIVLAGGLAGVVRPWLSPQARGRLSEPLADALEGALVFAGAPMAVGP